LHDVYGPPALCKQFCLTILDTKTPALAVAVASIVNIVGDLALSPRWGIQGAAVATAMATVASCAILVNKVRKTVADWKSKEEAAELIMTRDHWDRDYSEPSPQIVDGVNNAGSIISVNSTASSETVAHDPKLDDIPFWSLPDKASIVKLFRLAGPIFYTMMAKILCYALMTVRATNFGVTPLAAHNIMTRYELLSPLIDTNLTCLSQ
jgi:Na+-driven multidrug efflux pump